MGTTYYFDTSALVKRYHVEEGTSHVDRVFAEPDATFIIASITIAELTAAIARKYCALHKIGVHHEETHSPRGEFERGIAPSVLFLSPP